MTNLTAIAKSLNDITLNKSPLPSFDRFQLNERLETASDEIESFIADLRAAWLVTSDLEPTVHALINYCVSPLDSLSANEKLLLTGLTRLTTYTDILSILESAAEAINDYLDDFGDFDVSDLNDVDFETATDEIREKTESFFEPLEIKRYFDEDGNTVGFYILITSGGPALYLHWLESTGGFITASGRVKSGSETCRLDSMDLETINDLYFAGELDL